MTPIQMVRTELSDTDVVFPLLSDEEYEYFLEKNNNSIRKTTLDAAKTILFKLASMTNEEVDVLAYKGSDYFRQYKEALIMYVKNPEYGSISMANPYAGGISLSDIADNLSNSDNNYVKVEKSIPVEGAAINLNNTSPFVVSNLPRDSDPFGF